MGGHDRTVIERACAIVGLDSSGASIIRSSENVLWQLPDHIVARAGRPATERTARREIDVARWLESHHFPAVRPLDGIPQPAVVEGRPVTFWHELPRHSQGTMSELGVLLRRLHSLPKPTDFDPGEIEPLVRVRERITNAHLLDDDDRSWLLSREEELVARWSALPPGQPRCLVHGDAWAGNVAVTEGGGALLLDFERSAFGPPEWDLTHSAIKYTSFGWAPGEYEKLALNYGYDVTVEYSGFDTLRDIRELRMTTFALQCADEDSKFAAQARLRVDCLRGRRGPRPWAGWLPTP